MRKLAVILISFFSLSASSAFAMGGNSESGFLALTELTAGMGTSGSQSSIQSRSMIYSELALRLGYRFKWLAPVIEGTYRYVGQTTSSDSVSGTNMAGSGYLLGAGLNFHFSAFDLTAMYDFSGSYALSKQTSGGSNENYTSPAGFRVSLGIHLNPSWDLIATYSNINYGNSVSNGTTTSLSGDLVNQTLYGLGLQYMF